MRGEFIAPRIGNSDDSHDGESHRFGCTMYDRSVIVDDRSITGTVLTNLLFRVEREAMPIP